MDRSAAVAAIFEPVQPPTTFEETVERLGTAIKVGLLPPGTRLPPERELADELGISRSTLRQALTALVQSRMLVAYRGRGGGTFVAESPPLNVDSEPPDDPWMRAVLDYRVAIETGAASLAAERAGEDHLAAMTGVQGQMSELIAHIAHPEEVLTRSNEQHRELVAALGRRDGATAVTLVRQHLAGTEHILAGLMPAAREV